MNGLDVWLIQTGEPLPLNHGVRKMRTALLADKLINRGHSIFWWASAFEHQRKVWISRRDKEFRINSRYTIRVIRGTGYKKNYSLLRYLDHIVIAQKFRNQCTKIKTPDIIIASTPCHHLAYESVIFANKADIPIIVDIRDPWPDLFLNPLKKMKLEKLGRLVLSYDFYKVSKMLRRADVLTSTSKGFLDWGLHKAKRSRNGLNKVFYTAYQNNHQRSNSEFQYDKNKKIFIYLGTFGKSYELDLIVDVAQRFQCNNCKDIAFVIVGTGEQYGKIKLKASKLHNVILTGWLEKEDILRVLHAAWAGIVPCNSVKNTIPNKIFEYLSAGLPIISSLEGEIEQAIEKQQLGCNYSSGDAEGLYNAIQYLASDPLQRDRMSSNALKFYENYGDADRVYSQYATYIETLMTSHAPSNSLPS